MMAALLMGSGLALAAALQPGPLQAYLLGQALARGWRGTLPAVLAPLLSDIPVALVTLLLLRQLPAAAQTVLRLGGGLLLLALAGHTLWSARTPAADGGLPVRPLRTLGAGILVNLLNPNPWLAWGLVLGPACLAAWRGSPLHAAALVGSFYGLLCLLLAALVGSAALAGRRLARFRPGFAWASGLALAALGFLQIRLALA